METQNFAKALHTLGAALIDIDLANEAQVCQEGFKDKSEWTLYATFNFMIAARRYKNSLNSAEIANYIKRKEV